MARPKRRPRPVWWIACCRVLKGEGVEATFQILVDGARTANGAVQECVARLRDLHKRTTLFREGDEIYLDHVLRLPRELMTPVLVNWTSTSKTAPITIHFGVPVQADTGITTFSPPDTSNEQPLVSFRTRKKRSSSKERSILNGAE